MTLYLVAFGGQHKNVCCNNVPGTRYYGVLICYMFAYSSTYIVGSLDDWYYETQFQLALIRTPFNLVA